MAFGTLTKLPSGSTRARYTGPNGKRYSKTFRSKAEAASWLRTEEKKVVWDEWQAPGTPKLKASEYTVESWLTEWLEIQAARLKPSTLDTYRTQIRLRIFDAQEPAAFFKSIPLSQVTRQDVAAWFDAITKQYPTGRLNHEAWGRVKSAFNAAVDRDLIQTNPADGLKMARRKPTPYRKELPTAEQFHLIIDQLPARYQLVGALTFFHGLRLGEALALRRKDVVQEDGRWYVWVRGTAYRTSHGMQRLDTPKTSAGHRKVPVFEKFNSYLRRHMRNFVAQPADSWLFTTQEGKPVMDTSYRTRLGNAKKKAGLEDSKISSHYGRVWLITELAEKGLPIPAIGQILGQTDLSTITEVYMRAKPDHVLAVLDEVGRQL